MEGSLIRGFSRKGQTQGYHNCCVIPNRALWHGTQAHVGPPQLSASQCLCSFLVLSGASPLSLPMKPCLFGWWPVWLLSPSRSHHPSCSGSEGHPMLTPVSLLSPLAPPEQKRAFSWFQWLSKPQLKDSPVLQASDKISTSQPGVRASPS